MSSISNENKTHETIAEEQKELIQKYYKVDFAKLAKLVINDLQATNTTGILFKTFSKEQVMNALQNPQKNEKTLRNLSKFLYIVSPHYKRLCDYYGQMALLYWYIKPYKLDLKNINIEMFKKAYQDTLNLLENMNIQHEFSKIMQVAFREGVFYGYEYSTDDSYFIQKLDPDYCTITGFEDGVFSFKFNFKYFEQDESLLDNFAPEFKEKYLVYKKLSKNKNKKRTRLDKLGVEWQELSGEKTICIKPDETVMYPFPPFIGVIPDIYEIQEYKSLKKANTEMQNIAILVGSIPYMNDKSGVANNFALDLDTAIQFGNQVNNQLPDQFGFLLSVYDKMELFKLNDDKVGTDKVEEATNNFWRSSGVSKELFTDSGSTDAAMKYSTITDEQSVFTLLLQIERWLNRKLKYENNKKYKFKIKILPITNFNKSDFINRELKAAQFSISNKIRLAVSLGLDQSEVSDMAFLENEVLGLHELWIPLSSSHTSPGGESENVINDGKGKPNKETTNQNSDGGDEE